MNAGDQAFQSRMADAVRRVGGVSAMAERTGLSRGVIHKYLNGESEPSRDRLVAIAKAADVNVGWLAAGCVEVSSSTAAAAPLNKEVLRSVIAFVEAWLKQNRRQMDPEKKAEIVMEFYGMAAEDIAAGRPPPDERRMSTFLRLVG